MRWTPALWRPPKRTPATERQKGLPLVVPDRLGYYSCVTEEKNPAAVELGRRGGLKGGKARAAKMTKEERSESARKAARARWAKKRQQDEETEG